MDVSTKNKPMVISKEEVAELKFTSSINVNKYPGKIGRHLNWAMKLGNTYRNKVKILFQDDAGLKQVETTIWAAGDKNIALKAGVTIPIHRIIEIKFL